MKWYTVALVTLFFAFVARTLIFVCSLDDVAHYLKTPLRAVSSHFFFLIVFINVLSSYELRCSIEKWRRVLENLVKEIAWHGIGHIV